MGRVKDIFKSKNITDKLIAMGFLCKRYMQGDIRYVRAFCDKNYCLWVSVSFDKNKLYLYSEFYRSGFLWGKSCDIPKDVLLDCDSFIDWLDTEVESEEQLWMN